MGQYLIPKADPSPSDVSPCIQVTIDAGVHTDQQVWDWGAEGGILFTDPDRTDEECAALYAGFVFPTGAYESPLPPAVRTHLQHLRDYRDADPATITNAQTVHVVKDLIRAVFLLNERYETEG